MSKARQVGEQCGAKLALDIALQELPFEVTEEPISMNRVISRDDASTGDSVDDVDSIKQRPAAATDLERHVAQRLHRSVSERRRPRAAARQCQDDEHVPRVVGIGFDALQPVTLADVRLLLRRVDLIVRVAPGDDRQRAQQLHEGQPARPQCSSEFRGHGVELRTPKRMPSIRWWPRTPLRNRERA